MQKYTKKFVLTKNTIESFPWGDLQTKEQVPDFCKEYQLKARPWILEQMQAYISRMPLVKTSSGKIDGTKTLANAGKSDPVYRGIWLLVTTKNRGDFVLHQNANNVEYSALVPFMLAAYKKYHSIPYSNWENTKYCFDPKMQAALDTDPELWKACLDLGSETLLEVLDFGLTVKADPTRKNKAMSAYRITGKSGTVVDELSPFAQVMLLQFWVAHPQLRTKYMILDPFDWDLMPEPLIKTDIGIEMPRMKNQKVIKEEVELDTPWN